MAGISLKEARKRLGRLVRAAARGESAVITVRGKEAARIGPIEPGSPRTLPDLTEFRASIRIAGKPMSQTVIDMRREGRS